MLNVLYEAALSGQKAAAEEMLKSWNRLLAVPKVVDQSTHVRVATTPADVVYKEDMVRLLRYTSPEGPSIREPLLISYALVNRPYILDLQPQRSVIRQLLKRGFDVYLIDWGVPSAADRTLRLQDYVCELLRSCVDFVHNESGGAPVNLFGYCMGGAMSAMFTALYPELINTLTLLAAPIDFAGDDSLLHVWTQEKYFDVDRLVDAYGNCPAPFLQLSFQLMKPVQNYIEKYLGFLENMQDEKYLENFFAMEQWNQDNIPVAGETFREFVKCLYQRNQLVKGEFKLKGRKVDLRKIACPLLLLTADGDHLVSPASTRGIIPHVSSKDVKEMSIHAGHIGLAVSSKAHKTFWPEAVNWIAERSTPLPTA